MPLEPAAVPEDFCCFGSVVDTLIGFYSDSATQCCVAAAAQLPAAREARQWRARSGADRPRGAAKFRARGDFIIVGSGGGGALLPDGAAATTPARPTGKLGKQWRQTASLDGNGAAAGTD